ncbi:outer membrane lipoprotein-sorting protein [Prevotella sp. A2931]|uniref:Outer membrane lipoprotein-sorting protein n=1 Tax=Prevotella illustrans TaxID=2800387 RepID=A0ABS3M6F2_9BACT|nr:MULTISPECIES: outer membrane lipoprotein-sorting protein [Prevotella]MBO1363757.1 outer membrane lipoprotein-sorting protein [Prevotella illustrans]PTL26245.1 outer membrane lipoprotein-sorting protein [Prevotella sp. oral taxon 820]
MKTRHFILSLIALMAVGGAQAAQLSGREIMQKVKNRADGDSRYAAIEMTLIQKSGHKRVRKLESWAMDIGKDTKKIMFFTYPGDVKGTGFLTWDYDNTDKVDDKWLYLPAMKKTRRISGKSSKTDYFMGSDFTYDDMSTRSVDEEKHTFVREETFDGHRCWVVESVPYGKDDIYTRRVTWIRQDCLIPVKAEYYDKLNKLHRSLTISNIEKVQGFWTMHSMQMENVQTGHQTLIRMSNQKFNVKVSPNLFTVSKLEKGL